MKLYSYWRSTTSYRVRAALNLKSLPYDSVGVDLLSGAQHSADYRALNVGSSVPTLVLDDGTVLTQSLAILDHLDAIAPQPRLLPVAPVERARVLAAAHVFSLDVHPINNLRVIARLKTQFNADDSAVRDWMLHWMAEGCTVLESQIRDDTVFSFGGSPDLADLCIVAQFYNARRWGLGIEPYPKLRRVESACLALPAIAAAHPDQQHDAKVN